MSVESVEVGQGFYKNPQMLTDIIRDYKELLWEKSFYTTMINDYDWYIRTIQTLRDHDYKVVPHIPVKSLCHEKIMYVLDICKETKNKTALILWWGKNVIVDYASTLDFLNKDENKKSLEWMKKLCFAGHPRILWKHKSLEWHFESLEKRVSICADLDLEYSILTQLEFSRAQILHYISQLDEKNIDISKVVLGQTTTHSFMKMYKYVMLCWFSLKDMIWLTPCVLPLLFSHKDADELQYKDYSFSTHLYSFWGMKKSILPYLEKIS